MTQDKRGSDNRRSKDFDNSSNRKNETSTNTTYSDIPWKVVVRRLPPSLTAEKFLEQISPVADYNYFNFIDADMGLGQYAFSRAYISFVNRKDIVIFQEKFDGYVFVDEKGTEYPAVVEFAPYPRMPKKKMRKPDPRNGTIETDPDYMKFLESLKPTENEVIPPPETLLEEIEAKEKVLKANHGCPKVTTPLIEYLTKRKEEKRNAFLEHAREEKRRKEMERRKQRDDERRRKLEKERERKEMLLRQKQKEKEEKEKKKDEVQMPVKFQLLKNPDRDKEKDEKESKLTAVVAAERVETAKPFRDESREKHVTRLENDRRMDDRKDFRDKNKKIEKSFGERERRKDDDRRRDSESVPKDLNYGSKKRQDHYSDTGGRDGDRVKPAESHVSSSDKDLAREKSQEKESSTRYYGGYRGQERDTKTRDSYSGREAKTDTKYDQGRQKESDRKSTSTIKDSRYQRSESGYSEFAGGRRYHQESRDQQRNQASSRNKSNTYVGRKEGSATASREFYADKGRTADDKSSTKAECGSEKETAMLSDEMLARRGSADSTGSSTSDTSKLSSTKTANSDGMDAKKTDDADWMKGDKADASNRQRVRYKDRPERAIYNPAKRAVERQKEATSNR